MNFFQKIISAFLAFLAMIGFIAKGTEPEITEGKFDFVLTYEVDGKIKTIEGTYVCQFEGVEYYLDGYSRNWNGYIEGHEDSDRYALKTTEDGIIKVNLDLSPEFFMSDPHYKANDNTDFPKPTPYLYVVAEESENEYMGNYYEGDDVKIISFVYDEPIANEYK